MKHNDGIEVFLQARGTRFREFTNPYSHRSEQYHGAFGSRIISAKPTTEFDVVVRFDSRFRWFSSDGVLITIATHPGDGVLTERVQSTWLDIHHIHGDHLFSTYTLFTSLEDHAGVIKECMRVPVCYPTAAWIDSNHTWANQGCISIRIERGKLCGSVDNQSGPKRLLTDPPRLCLDMALPRRLVRKEWFRELRSESGLPYLFEYRNVPPEHIVPNQAEAAPEIEHESDCDSDVEFERTSNKRVRQSDPWGGADYQGDSDFEANHQVLTDRGCVAIRSSKRLRSAAGDNADNQDNPTHIEQSNPLDGGRKYRFILPAVPHHRAVETLPGSTLGVSAKRRPSRRQEPTPPPERSKAVRITTSFNESAPNSAIQSPAFAQHPPVIQPPVVTQPPAVTQSPALTESNAIVDLTSDDERPMKIENEPVVEHSPPIAPSDTTEGGSEDISDLEDQLAEIQLRRKIRAAKRKKEEARLRNVLGTNAVDGSLV